MQLKFHLWEAYMYLIVQMKIERAHLAKNECVLFGKYERGEVTHTCNVGIVKSVTR